MPVIAIVLVGTTAESAQGVLEGAVRAQRSGRAFTPVFLVDEPVLAPFRGAGYVAELVGPAGLEEAVREVRLTYVCSGVLAVDGSSPTAWQRLPEVLAGLHPGPPSGLLTRTRAVLRRVESRFR